MASITVLTPDGRRSERPLRAMNTIGRHPEQSIQILDRVVSKEHALITFADGRYWLQDMGSRNGTFVNGERIMGRTRMRTGDTITLGGTRLVFHDEREALPAAAGQVTIQPAQETQTAIRSRLQAANESSRRFLPELDIADNKSLRDDYEKLRVAFELNQALGTVVEPDVVMDRILEKAMEITQADRGVFLVIDGEGTPQPRAVRHRDGADAGQVQLSSTILNEVMTEHHAVLSSDAMIDSRFAGSHSIIMHGIRSTMCVPLTHDEQLLGMVHLDSKVATGVFTEKDLQLLTAFAHQAAVRLANARLVEQARHEALVRESLSRLLSPNLVEQVVQGDVALERGGQRRQVTVLFADIRGFTALSERKAPEELVSMLNEYFEIMADLVFQHEGTLDKFMGDEVMAVWGAPLAQPDHVARAVFAALSMRRAVEDYNRFRTARNEEPLKVGIGINTGVAVAGYMGATRTLSYTVIGDTVNTASRLCGHAGPGDILVSQQVVEAMGRALEFELREPAQLKGKSQPVPVHAVLGVRGLELDATRPVNSKTS
ncbi:MAG: adenylate/guanylate cyclase domain-containing protein [Bradymonadia bacterium]